MDLSKADVWAMTDSWQHRYHGQSYFLLFGPAALRNEAFTRFWDALPNLYRKDSVIRYGEIALSQCLLVAGLRVSAAWDYFSVLEHALIPSAVSEPGGLESEAVTRARSARSIRKGLNATHELWLELVDAGFPFIKCELLQKNPSCTSGVGAWHSIVQQVDAGLYGDILSHLKHAVRDTAP